MRVPSVARGPLYCSLPRARVPSGCSLVIHLLWGAHIHPKARPAWRPCPPPLFIHHLGSSIFTQLVSMDHVLCLQPWSASSPRVHSVPNNREVKQGGAEVSGAPRWRSPAEPLPGFIQ